MAVQHHQDLFDALCSALRRPLSEGGHVALTAALHDQPADAIAETLSAMEPDEALAVFNWLDDVRASGVLLLVDEELAAFLAMHAPAGRMAHMDGDFP
jgi:hypothetical protein